MYKIISLVKKSKPTPEDLKECKEKIQYHVYDACLGGNEVFSERSKFINDVLKDSPYVSLVSTYLVKDKDELDRFYGQFLEDGFEGEMICQNTVYENRRTKSLLKRKEFQDSEFKIISVHEGEGNREGTIGYARFETPEGRPFRSNVKGNFTYLRQLWADRVCLPGKMATIKYFNLSEYGVPRFPFIIGIRDYE